ncbi:MAG: hypothetical protein OXD41_02355 [Thaumarchaeota archaeon]|nr:hypothetical protein [Nitrososphaerota archaeon]
MARPKHTSVQERRLKQNTQERFKLADYVKLPYQIVQESVCSGVNN